MFLTSMHARVSFSST